MLLNDRRYIGIDGGGTKTICVLSDERGEIMAVCRGEASNVKSKPWGEVQQVITGLVDEALKVSETHLTQLHGMYLGLAGSDRPEDRSRWLAFLATQYPALNGRITVNNDAVTALATGTWGGRGIVLIAGTGSIAYGFIPESGQYIRVGGWGYLLGDEGSGYDLGKKGLTAIMNEYDGRGQRTALTELILDRLKFEDPSKLITHYYESENIRKEIAGASHDVLLAARLGDTVALKIVDEAVEELSLLVETVNSKMCKDDVKALPVILSGGLFSNELFVDRFRNVPTMRKYSVEHLTLPPVIGCILLALIQAGHTITEEIKERIRSHWYEKEGLYHETGNQT
ncbi:MAG: BadF/BadG/BcrA/BcrD ATPase family protein [Paenibacillaceae bacterium]